MTSASGAAKSASIWRRSLAGRITLALLALALVCTPLAIAAARWFDSMFFGVLASLLVAVPVAIWLTQMATKRWVATLNALRDGISSLSDQDYSVSVTASEDAELADLVAAYNALGASLRSDRLSIYQRELLLDTVIQATPLALVLTNPNDTILYSNLAARQLFNIGRKLEGHRLTKLLEGAPEPLRAALSADRDNLFTMDVDAMSEVWHVSQRHFMLNAQPHRLILLKQLTRELAAQESKIWKKVIRVIAHELNNSLAPISSLAHSGQSLAAAPDSEQLSRVFRTIEGRAAHLASFIDGYAQFAKLPLPRLQSIQWPDFLARLQWSSKFEQIGAPPKIALVADQTQIEQMLINLLKNAAESGSAADAISLTVSLRGNEFQIEVADRGAGLSADVLSNALLPFYSTKASGTGIGLTLSREIVEAHGGRIALANRDGGGATVTVWLPRLTAPNVS